MWVQLAYFFPLSFLRLRSYDKSPYLLEIKASILLSTYAKNNSAKLVASSNTSGSNTPLKIMRIR